MWVWVMWVMCGFNTKIVRVWERDAFAVERYALAAALDAKRETQAMERDALLTKHQRAAAEAAGAAHTAAAAQTLT